MQERALCREAGGHWTSRIDIPCACSFSASRNLATICSVVNLLAAATSYSIPTLIIESTNNRNGPKNGEPDSSEIGGTKVTEVSRLSSGYGRV
jgi:hypothetical protein